MGVRLIPFDELSDTDVAAWRKLAGRAIEPNPFYEPELALPAAEGLEERPSLLVVEDSGVWAACLPVHRRRLWHRAPLPCLAAWNHAYSFLGIPLAAPEDPEGALTAIIDEVATGWPGVLAFDRFGTGGPIERALDAGVDRSSGWALRLASRERAALRRRESGDYLAISSRHRKEARRARRKLEEAVGRLEPLERAGDPRAVEDFLELEVSGWKGEEGSAMLSRPGHARFFREMCATFAAEGRLQLLSLESERGPVAMKCNLRAGDCLFCFKIAYDESLRRFSPGIQLELANIDVFHSETDAAWMDSCADPKNAMINRLWPDRRPLSAVLVPASGAIGWTSRHGTRAVTALRSRLGWGS